MDIVQRYIAAVQRQLPEQKQQEIGRELEANILDQLEAIAAEKQQPLTEADIAVVLKAMGHPQQVAQQFVPPTPLISQYDLPVYFHTLYMVLGVLFVLQVMGATINWVNSDIGLLLYLKSIASGFIQDGCFAFTAITMAFMLKSAQHSAQEPVQYLNWQPQKLPAISAKWQHISLQDIFTDLATYAFLLVVIWYPLGNAVEPKIWLTASARELLQWCSPIVVAGMALSLWQLKQRFWDCTLLWLNIILNALFCAVMLYLALGMQVLQLDENYWQGVFTQQQLQQSVVVALLITMLFPLGEMLGHVRKLRQFKH